MNNPNASKPFPGPLGINGFQSLSSTCSEETAVQVAIGNLTKTLFLVHVPAVGFPLDFALFYNAQGSGWTHTYSPYLVFNWSLIEGPPYNPVEGVTCNYYSWTLESVVFYAEGGQQFTFVPYGTGWALSPGTRFFTGVLNIGVSPYYSMTNPTISFPDGSYYEFGNATYVSDDNYAECNNPSYDTEAGVSLITQAKLTSIVDPYGNALTMTYTSGQLTAITEPTGRSITLGYTSDVLTSVTDPNSNETTLDWTSGLQVSGPDGCTISYGYTGDLITSMTDPNSHTWSYSYSGTKLTGVTSPEATENTISYAFDTTTEGWATDNTFNRTKLTDARGNLWECHFDQSNNLWRIIDPLGHQQRFYWDQNQQLLFTSAPFAPTPSTANWDNAYNRFTRAAHDSSGNQLLSIDEMGRMTQMTYNAQNKLTSITPGRGCLGIGGNWPAQFGLQGYVLCGFAPGGDSRGEDVSSLPAYISSISYLDSGPSDSVRSHLSEATYYQHYLDPRTPQAQSSPQKALGYWTYDSAFTVTIDAAESVQYNLSVYANSADIGMDSAYTFESYEQYGRDTTFTVTDKVGTQTFRVYNDAPGAWVTFPVSSDTTHPVTITIAPSGSNTGSAQIGIMAFDAYDNHTSTFTYNDEGDILTAVDPLGNTSTWTYNTNGTVATFTDARSHTTTFTYGDSYDNLTQITDALSNQWTMTYDLNGNVLTTENPLSHTWTNTYDGKNRLKTVTDPLSNETQWAYDDAGNLLNVIDANSNETQFSYSPSNRLTEITDALSQNTTFGYDGSGNLITFQTPNNVAGSVQTGYTWDDAERLTTTTLGQEVGTPTTFYAQIGAAYDGLDQVRAITPPNGMQSTLASINLTGAQNWLSNPGMETINPFNTANPVRWNSSGSRTTSKAHSGAASFQVNASYSTTPYGNQTPVYVRAGEKLIANGWVASNATGSGPDVWLGLVTLDQSADYDEATGATQAAPLSTSGWVALNPVAFQVPGDGQYPRFPVSEFRLHVGWSSGGVQSFWDDMVLNSVSSSVDYDLSGAPRSATSPTGAQSSMLYDRYGRTSRRVDPDGNAVSLTWDGKNQVLTVTDGLGNTTTFAYDANGNLTSVTDALSNETQYAYTVLNQLETITYPDSTTEAFTYDNAGRLHTYENARSQTRTFTYDNANRLTEVEYSDTTTVLYTYDNMTHVHTRTDRNLDVTTFTYDDLYRVTEVQRVPGLGSPTVGWTQTIGYDADGNRTSFSSAVTGETTQSWSVPSGGYDVLDRLVTLDDRFSNSLSMSYDVDSNRTGVSFPYGSPVPATTATFDIADRLLSLTTANGAGNALALSTGYDPASLRTFVSADGDVTDYVYDADGQLVGENRNQFSEQSASGFTRGTLSGTLVDPSAPSVSLASLADTFSGTQFSTDRWRLCFSSSEFVGLRLLQNDGLTMWGPEWPSNLVVNGLPTVYDAITSAGGLGLVENLSTVTGNFDIQVSFANFQGDLASSGDTYSSGGSAIGLRLSTVKYESTGAIWALVCRDDYPSYSTDFSYGTSPSHASTSDTSGMLRITRSGSTVTLYYWDSGTSSWASLSTTTILGTGALYVSLFTYWNTYCTGTFSDFQVNGSTVNYPSSGTYTSAVYDAGSSVTWTGLTWDATVPGGATLEFQVAASNSPTGPFSFIGPGGTSASYFTTSGGSFPTLAGRYFCYQATLEPGSSGTTTPSFSQVVATYDGTNTSAGITYEYDDVGNLTGKTTVVPSTTTVTETRTINDLNQITANTVVGATTTDWTFDYDDSGNMSSRTNTTLSETTSYTWDEDNRLTLVTLPGGATVAYTYDVLGRMLTRTDSSGTATFVWDGMDLVMEFDAAGNQTRYYVVNGELLMFERTPYEGSSTTYQVLCDHIGSVRKVLDSSNDVKATYDYDAYGNQLASTSDSVPDGGLQYRFVGAAGVRWDSAAGLYYMRQRWYDPGLARFMSRDPLRRLNRYASLNVYAYVDNNPTTFVDPMGTIPPDAQPLTPQQYDEVQAAIQQIALVDQASADSLEGSLLAGNITTSNAQNSFSGATTYGEDIVLSTRTFPRGFGWVIGTLYHENGHVQQLRCGKDPERLGFWAYILQFVPAEYQLEFPVYTNTAAFATNLANYERMEGNADLAASLVRFSNDQSYWANSVQSRYNLYLRSFQVNGD